MHYHAEVWVAEKKDYITQVHRALAGLHEEDGGFYDWYVIGGRWSGEHTLWLLKDKFGSRKINRINDEFDKKYGWWTNAENSREKRAEQYEEIFRNHISKKEYDGIMPAWRDTYKDNGYEDDIIAVSQVPKKFFDCYTLVLSERGGEWKDGLRYFHSQIFNGSAFQKTDFNPVKILEEHNIYDKYTCDGFLVTVDYHS